MVPGEEIGNCDLTDSLRGRRAVLAPLISSDSKHFEHAAGSGRAVMCSLPVARPFGCSAILGLKSDEVVEFEGSEFQHLWGHNP
jgi:hypothetical protein